MFGIILAHVDYEEGTGGWPPRHFSRIADATEQPKMKKTIVLALVLVTGVVFAEFKAGFARVDAQVNQLTSLKKSPKNSN